MYQNQTREKCFSAIAPLSPNHLVMKPEDLFSSYKNEKTEGSIFSISKSYKRFCNHQVGETAPPVGDQI